MSRQYPLKLRTPLEPLRRPSLADIDRLEEIREDERQRLMNERLEKMMLLLDHYEISHDDPARKDKLLWALIYAHVPGFGLKDPSARGVGGPAKWTTDRNLLLIADVLQQKMDTGKTVKKICEDLSTTDRYRGIRSLQKRYDEARRKDDIKNLEEGFGLVEDRPDLWRMVADIWAEKN